MRKHTTKAEMRDTAERPDGPAGSRFGRSGLILGGVSAALAAALGKTKAAAASIISSSADEAVIEGDPLAGRFPRRLIDASSDAAVFPSTIRLYHITDPTFDPLGAALDSATLQVIEDDSLHSASRFSHIYDDAATDLAVGPASNAMYDLSTPIPLGAPVDPATLQLLNFVPGRMPFTARNLAGADAATFEGNVVIGGDLLAGRFPHQLGDASSTAEVFPSTVRLYHITDPDFDPLGAALDRATLQVIEDDSLHSASRFSHIYDDAGTDLWAGPASNAMYDLSTPIPQGAPLDPATLQLLNFVPGRMPFTARNFAGADAATFEGNVDCDGDLVVRGQMFCSSIREAVCPAGSNRCLIQDADCKTTSFVAPMVSQDLDHNSLQQVIPGDGQVEFVFAKALRAPFTLSYLLLQRAP